METALRLALENFTLTVLILGALAALVALAAEHRPRHSSQPAEAFLAFYLLFSIAIAFFYNFVMHVFFGEMTARFIGWEDSPFQAEVGFASLGFAVVGLLAFQGSPGMRLAAILGPAFFLWGAAGGHVYQMVTAGNFAPGNAGVIFWTDIFGPLIGLALYVWRYGWSRSAALGRTPAAA